MVFLKMILLSNMKKYTFLPDLYEMIFFKDFWIKILLMVMRDHNSFIINVLTGFQLVIPSQTIYIFTQFKSLAIFIRKSQKKSKSQTQSQRKSFG